jgi:hypothetical protein
MNLFPPLVLLLVLTGFGLIMWRRRLVGVVILALSSVLVAVLAVFCGVEKRYKESISYDVIEVGEYITLRFTNSHGDSFTAGPVALAERVKRARPPKIEVEMTCTYDFGEFRSYRVFRIDGELQ